MSKPSSDAPWNPIPVAPIGKAFFSRTGLSVVLTELVLFSPALVYALWPRPSNAPSPTSSTL